MARGVSDTGSPLAAEYDVGGDDDVGVNEPFTTDDIDAIVNTSRASIEDRRHILLRMRDDLVARSSMDLGGESREMIDQIDDALRLLDSPADGYGTPSAYGRDPQTRADQPDLELERRQEEGEDEDLPAGPKA